jgi:hypothetical protein
VFHQRHFSRRGRGINLFASKNQLAANIRNTFCFEVRQLGVLGFVFNVERWEGTGWGGGVRFP